METAIVALVAGALGAGLTGLLQLRRDRVETLRQRQLDAADTFAAAVSQTLLQVKVLLDSRPGVDGSDARQERWRARLFELRESMFEQVAEVAAHAPRVELLFGVNSPAAIAANQAVYDLSLMAKALQPPFNDRLFGWAFELAAGAAFRFHDEANIVVAASSWRRRRHTPQPDDAFNEMVEEIEDELRKSEDSTSD